MLLLLKISADRKISNGTRMRAFTADWSARAFL